MRGDLKVGDRVLRLPCGIGVPTGGFDRVCTIVGFFSGPLIDGTGRIVWIGKRAVVDVVATAPPMVGRNTSWPAHAILKLPDDDMRKQFEREQAKDLSSAGNGHNHVQTP